MSTVARSLSLQSLYPTTRKHYGWVVLAVFSAIIFAIDLPLLNPHHPYRVYQSKVAWALMPHAMLGTFALLAGGFQFSSRLRRRNIKLHRILGRFYVAAVLVAAPLGIMITVIGPKDSFFTFGVAVHASVWFITTLMAFLTARNRHIPEHRQWMVRSYILTFSFVASRVLAPVWFFMGVKSPHEYGIVDATLNVAYLLIADISLNWRQLTSRSSSSRS